MDTSNPSDFVNAQLLSLHVGKQVRALIQVVQPGAGSVIGKSTDGVQLTVKGTPPGPLTKFVEVIGIADSDKSIQASIWNNFGDAIDSWQFGVPAWEKKFCTSVGSVPWKKLLDTKRCMYLYENIVQWNDSAGEEAFQNAKNRFWAKINGLPCDIPSPDPDIYIDEIDWNSSIDPELISDLEREPKPSDDETKGEGVIVGDPFLLNQPIACTGWGDAEEDFKKDAGGDAEHWGPWGKADNRENPWGPVSDQNKGAMGGWGSSWNEPVADQNKEAMAGRGSSWNAPVSDQNKEAIGEWSSSWKWENNNNIHGWNQNVDCSRKNMEWKRVDGVCWGNNDASHGADNSGASWYNSRYRTSRFQGDYRQKDQGWRDRGRRNRVNAGYQSSGTWNNRQQV